jgi:hypothetical protein
MNANAKASAKESARRGQVLLIDTAENANTAPQQPHSICRGAIKSRKLFYFNLLLPNQSFP